MMGSANTIVHESFLDRLRNDPDINDRITITYISDADDGQKYIEYKTPLLRDGYHGRVNITLENDGVLRFSKCRT